jgi:hypothetical protein
VKHEDLARALAQPGRLSPLEKEALWQRIEARRRGGWWRPRVVIPAAGALAAAAVAVIVLVGRPDRTETFTARGSASTGLVLRCGADREAGDCRIGDRLAFDFGAQHGDHVALFARSPSGVVIWYAPAASDGASLPLATHAATGVLDTVAVLDASYAPGRYEVTAVFSPRPMTRDDVRALERDGQLVPPPGGSIEVRSFTITAEAP